VHRFQIRDDINCFTNIRNIFPKSSEKLKISLNSKRTLPFSVSNCTPVCDEFLPPPPRVLKKFFFCLCAFCQDSGFFSPSPPLPPLLRPGRYMYFLFLIPKMVRISLLSIWHIGVLLYVTTKVQRMSAALLEHSHWNKSPTLQATFIPGIPFGGLLAFGFPEGPLPYKHLKNSPSDILSAFFAAYFRRFCCQMMSDTVVMERLYVAANFFTIVSGSNLDQGT
jgi:hypothetical protein